MAEDQEYAEVGEDVDQGEELEQEVAEAEP